MSIAFVGTGAIGATVGAWLSESSDDIWFVDLPPVVESIKQSGVTTFWGDAPNTKKHHQISITEDLANVPRPEVVFISVKNYSLDAVAQMVKEKLGSEVIVVGLQNGVENQSILPQHFKNVVFGIVAFNAWVESPNVFGFQKKGPIVLGVIRPELLPVRDKVAAILERAMPVERTDRIVDAAHSKMIVNLTNSLTTLIGHPFQPVDDRLAFQKLLTRLTYEGVEIVRAAGFKEVPMGGMPSWLLMKAAAKLPPFLTKRAFEKNVRKMVMSSMAQDILQKKGSQSELESLNGYLLGLADRHGVEAPFNRRLYEICREKFSTPDFAPMQVSEVWRLISQTESD